MTTDDTTGVPNLDDCDPGDLMLHKQVFNELSRYCTYRYAAHKDRLEGRIQDAQQFERLMETTYQRLPAWAKW